MRWNLRALAIWIALAPVGASADQAATCAVPIDLHVGWTVAAPEKKAGFRSLGDAWADTTTAHGRLMLCSAA
jgi:hypothetical protein